MAAQKARSILLSGATALTALWLLSAYLAVPRLIEKAYLSQAWPILNRVLAGEPIRPLERYLDRWYAMAWRLTLCAVVLNVLLLLITRPGLERIIATSLHRYRRLTTRAGLAGTSVLRRRMVHAFIGLLVGASLFDIFADLEHWPFSQYPMYSGTQREPVLEVLRAFGVSEADASEIPLLNGPYILPFDQSRLYTALGWIQSDSERLEEALQDLLCRYEELRRAARHNGPQLSAIRLYRLRWHLDAWSRNVETPDQAELVLEIRKSS